MGMIDTIDTKNLHDLSFQNNTSLQRYMNDTLLRVMQDSCVVCYALDVSWYFRLYRNLSNYTFFAGKFQGRLYRRYGLELES